MSTRSKKFNGLAGSLPENEESDFPTQSVIISRLQTVTSRKPIHTDDTFNKLEIAQRLKLRNGNSVSYHDRSPIGSPVQSIDETDTTLHNIDDILSLSIKDKQPYNLIDRCINVILNTWNPFDIAEQSIVDIETELMDQIPTDYEALFNHFYNSSAEICSVLHRITSKILSDRLLLDGTKMIHIPNNPDEFNQTFGDLSNIASNDPNRNRRTMSTDSVTSPSTKSNNLSRLKLHNERSNQIDGKFEKSCRRLLFQRPCPYLDYHASILRMESEQNDDETIPAPIQTANSYESRSSNGVLQMSVFKKDKKNKIKHPVVECEGCGELMDMNDAELQQSVITYEVQCIGETFFFHDELCVNLRKYKEIIRKYVAESGEK